MCFSHQFLTVLVLTLVLINIIQAAASAPSFMLTRSWFWVIDNGLFVSRYLVSDLICSIREREQFCKMKSVRD